MRLLFGSCLIALAVFVTIVLLSLGRLDAQARQIQGCRVHGQLAFPGSAQNWNEDGLNATGNRYIALCMHNAGFSFDFAGKFCRPEMDASEISNKWCYRSGRFGLLTDVDIAMNGGFDDWPSALWCPRMRMITKSYCAAHGWFVD